MEITVVAVINIFLFIEKKKTLFFFFEKKKFTAQENSALHRFTDL